ncbi:MAG TPA: hypothetical protein VIP46_15950 [Pyrinomonadaceae bacterium]
MDDYEARVDEAFRVVAEDESPLYLRQPIPSELDSKIGRLVRMFRDAPEGERKHFFKHDDEDTSWLLITFAERSAALSVREKSRDRILDGLLALIIEDYKVDPRDNLTRLALLYDAATKSGASPEELFSEAASYANNAVARSLLDFPRRKPADRSLKAFYYKEVEGPDGFKYELHLPWEHG